jgi:hypothetical protein
MFDEKELASTLEAIRKANTDAKRHVPKATPVEQALIDAIQSRVPEGLDELAFRSCNEAYAAAMGSVYEKLPKLFSMLP